MYSQQACAQAKVTQDPSKISISSVHAGIAQGQLRLEAMLQKMNEMPVGRRKLPKIMKDTLGQARYGTLKLEDNDNEVDNRSGGGSLYGFGDDEIVYH